MNIPRPLHRPIAAMVAGFIRKQNRKYAPRATAIDDKLRSAIAPFFRADLLDSVRVLVLEGEQVSDPGMYHVLRLLGIRDLPTFGEVAAVTFANVIVAHQPFSAQLLFHEMVHAEQYRQLGIDGFSRLYASGFLLGGGYEGIPLEVNAYELDGRFGRNPRAIFSVEQIVSDWIRNGRFDLATP